MLTFAISGCSGQDATGTTSTQPTSEQQTSPTPATGTEKIREHIFRTNTFVEPPTADPGILDDIASETVTRALFDGLTRIGQDNKPHEAAAEKIEVSPDGLTYIFTIRDAKWSNGDPVTAYDFEFAWKRVLDPSTGSKSPDKLYYLKNGKKAHMGQAKPDEIGVKATNDKTLVVTLESPAPFFLELTAYPTYYPVNKKLVESNTKWAVDPNEYVSNGPFKLETWDHKSKMVLAKNENYWDANTVKLDKIELSMIEDPNTELSMFENGELDLAGTPLGALPFDAMPTLKESGKLEIQPYAATYWYKFNTEKPPFNNVKIRKAFTYAINRQQIIDNVTQGNQLPATSALPPSMTFKQEPFFHDGDIQTAKQLLAEGMKEMGMTKLPAITLSFNTSEGHKKIAEAIQDQWRKALGVDVQLNNQEWKVYLETIHQGNYQVGRLGWAAQYNDPVNILELFKEKSGANNDTGWENPQYKELLSKSTLETNPTKRKELLAQAEQILMNELPIAPIYYYTNNYVKQQYVNGLFVSDTGRVDWKWTTLTK
nr:peptide ABC transporter substrate-binding protein [Brevibacillus choshinensis]